ncbi:MAG TPA: carboxymuconolactone decarboxylase family protein [Burkholderiales bacterium]|jgi:4-carboxymuconolactone decarboxylase|nr:carboxymuconolactone decarboxylase family protein [Burkholderiales bacterium]
MATQSTRRERMSKLNPENMTEAQRKAAAELASGPRGEVRGPFNVLLRSPELMSPLQKVGEYLRFRCQLDRRIAEMATLIAARHWTQVYEWNAHHPLALKAGLKADIAQAIAEGRRPTGMAVDEEIVYDVLTEALQNKSVSDVTYERGIKQFGEQNLVDVLAIAGYYAMLALLLNVARTQLPEGREAGMPHFPN